MNAVSLLDQLNEIHSESEEEWGYCKTLLGFVCQAPTTDPPRDLVQTWLVTGITESFWDSYTSMDNDNKIDFCSNFERNQYGTTMNEIRAKAISAIHNAYNTEPPDFVELKGQGFTVAEVSVPKKPA